jgi:DNA-binding protein
MAKLPATVMEALLKKAGAKRVSESAKDELNNALKKKVETITQKAMTFSKHAGRKTLKKEDIDLASG